MSYAIHRSVSQPHTLELILSEFHANADLEAETFTFDLVFEQTFEAPIIAAIERYNMSESVCILLKHGANPNRADNRGNYLLHNAACNSYSVKYLLDAGADPGTAGRDGAYPLHMSARCGNSTSVANLLAAGADPDVRDDVGHTPLYYARLWQHEQVVELFAEHGYFLDTENEQRLAQVEKRRAAERRVREVVRMAQALGEILIDLLVILVWAGYLGAVIWANANHGQNITLATSISKYNFRIGPVLAAIAVGVAAGFIFVAMFSTSHGGYPIVANGIPVGIGAGLLTLIVIGVLNNLFRGNSAVALTAPILSVGFPAAALVAMHT